MEENAIYNYNISVIFSTASAFIPKEIHGKTDKYIATQICNWDKGFKFHNMVGLKQIIIVIFVLEDPGMTTNRPFFFDCLYLSGILSNECKSPSLQ